MSALPRRADPKPIEGAAGRAHVLVRERDGRAIGARCAVRGVREVVRVADIGKAAVDQREQQLGELGGAARGLSLGDQAAQRRRGARH